MAKNTQSTNTWGILSIILGIIGLFLLAGFFLGIIAIICAYNGLRKDKKKFYSRIGIVLGIICFILGILWVIIALIFFI